MYSLNVPVPGSVARLAADLRPQLVAFERVRDRHSLVVKRFGDEHPLPHLRERLRVALVDAPAFEVRSDGIGVFERPVSGSAPVVYLSVESPGLRALHERLVEAFGAIEELEGSEYVPHVTLARGGSAADAERIASLSVEPVTWTVSRLDLWDARYRETVGAIRLPA